MTGFNRDISDVSKLCSLYIHKVVFVVSCVFKRRCCHYGKEKARMVTTERLSDELIMKNRTLLILM